MEVRMKEGRKQKDMRKVRQAENVTGKNKSGSILDPFLLF